MKRIMAAAFIAIMSHAMIFTMNPSWLAGKKVYDKRPPAITVTMSYKKKPAPPKLPPKVTVKKINKKEVIKPRQVIKTPAPVKVEEKSVAPEPQSMQNADIQEDVTYSRSAASEEVDTQPSETEAVIPAVITEAEPLYKVNPEPPYPKMARKRGYQGTVILSVLVNKEGRAENLWVFESSGYNILDNTAIDAVKEWLFEPGKQGDTPVDMWVQVPVKFEIK
jgi:periplasmic protein TonB